MDNLKKYLPKGSFLVIMLCFFLPFIVVKCNYNNQEMEIARVSWMSLVYGGKMNVNIPDINSYWATSEKKQKSEPIEVNIYVLLAFLLALVWFVISFTSLEKAKQISLIISILWVISMLIFTLNPESGNKAQKDNQYSKMITVWFWSGYYLVFLLYILNSLYFWYELKYFDKYINKGKVKEDNKEQNEE